MTDTTASAPPITWSQVVQGLLPSLNTILVALFMAALGAGGTIVTQKAIGNATPKMSIPAADSPVTVTPVRTQDIRPAWEGLAQQGIDELKGLRADVRALQETMSQLRTPRVVSPRPATK